MWLELGQSSRLGSATPLPPLPNAGAQLRPNPSRRVSTQTRIFYAEVEDFS